MTNLEEAWQSVAQNYWTVEQAARYCDMSVEDYKVAAAIHERYVTEAFRKQNEAVMKAIVCYCMNPNC